MNRANRGRPVGRPFLFVLAESSTRGAFQLSRHSCFPPRIRGAVERVSSSFAAESAGDGSDALLVAARPLNVTFSANIEGVAKKRPHEGRHNIYLSLNSVPEWRLAPAFAGALRRMLASIWPSAYSAIVLSRRESVKPPSESDADFPPGTFLRRCGSTRGAPLATIYRNLFTINRGRCEETPPRRPAQ